jgi:uncharacterized LabA/DUF88 family protein
VRQTSPIDRVHVYIDGFNFYNGLIAKGWARYRWLDYPAFMRRYRRDPQVLLAVKYFTSLMMHEPDRLARQQIYLRALEVRGGIEVVPGKFSAKDVRCRKCEKTFSVPEEKRTDVNIATHLVADAFDDQFDTFIVTTADSDLIPAIDYVRQRFGKRFILLDPPRRHSDELAEIADIHLHSREHWLRQCQLPDPVEYTTRKGRIRRIHRPESWGRA